MRKIILITLILLILSTVSGFAAPAKNAPLHDKVLIYCNFDDMNYRKQLENKLLKYLKAKNITAAKSLELMPPLKEYTDSDVDKIMQDNGLDTLLEIKLLSSKVTTEDDAVAGNKFFKVYAKGWSTLASATMEFDVKIVDKQETAYQEKIKCEEAEDTVKEAIDELFDNFSYNIVRRQFLGKK